ncbi:hypothetical protein AAG906_027195 [Vitis piasezkii]
MWERLNLFKVGIPDLNDQTKSKAVLTTRSEQVCNEMEVHKRTRVECLNPDEAFSLFRNKVGENVLNSHLNIKRLAKIVVKECKGLPLAFIIIGLSMASRKTPREWDYDHLDNDTVKSCFLYCSLFPEDHEIWNGNLIELWIGEGFLDKFADIYEAHNQGEEIIRSLKLACLLEGDVLKGRCKMHDVIRDMGLWLSCDYGEEKHKSFIREFGISESSIHEYKKGTYRAEELDKIEVMILYTGQDIKEYEEGHVKLSTGCRFLDLTWLIYAPSLECMLVFRSKEMEEIIGGDECGELEIEQQNLCIFSRLVALWLFKLPNLRSIYRWALPFPFLTKIVVSSWTKLRKLPLNSSSATNTLEIIQGNSRWWEGLEWEDDNLKHTFIRYFVCKD